MTSTPWPIVLGLSVHIPKGDGSKTRPIGIPTFEDKVLQRAVVMALEPIYEEDFLDCSYGFRPRRGAHQALRTLRDGVMEMRGGGWVLEADIEGFFDAVDQGQLQQMVRRRVRDGVLLRLIGKWLKAGVMEEGRVYHPETGTPQGGVISPLLANIYLHEVLDVWFQREVLPKLWRRAFLVRYADDFVIVFKHERDARLAWALLDERFRSFNLRLHPEKTRLVPFQRPRKGAAPKDRRTGGGPGTFDLLGFTHYWGLSMKGNWVVKRKTAKSRFSRALRRFNDWCKANRHMPVRQQHEVLSRKLRGHDAYYGITGNAEALAALRYWVERIWHKWLSRRSWHARITWKVMSRLLKGPLKLPKARVVHSVMPSAAKP